MALAAEPLSYLWPIRKVIDEVRSITGEHDDTVVTDDHIRTHADLEVVQLFKMFPQVRDEYTIDIPFTLADVATMPPPSTAPLLYKTVAGVHYDIPDNFIILGWHDVYNDDTGSCRRCIDSAQIHGHQYGGNTLFARTIYWHARGRHLTVSVREGIKEDVVITGIAFRTPLAVLELEATGVATGIIEDADTTLLEAVRYKPVRNDWTMIDAPDDYMGIIVNKVCIKVWSQVGKQPTEQVQSSTDAQMAQLVAGMESRLLEQVTRTKQTQHRDQ